MKKALTDLSIRNFSIPDVGNDYHWDTTTPGFGLRVGAGGSKTFVVLIGSGRRQTIGRFPTISLAKARTEAQRILAEKTLGKVRPNRVAFDDAKDQFLKEVEIHNRPRTHRDYTRLLGRFFFGRKALSEITKADIKARLNPMPPSESAHALAVAKIFFSWCTRQDYLDRSPCEGLGAPQKAQTRERVLTEAEIKKFLLTAPKLGHPFGTMLLMMLFTGCRRGEVAALEWEFFDTKESLLTLPGRLTKNGRQHTIPYAMGVEELIAMIPKLDDKWLFPASRSHVKGKATSHFNGWSKLTNEFRKKLGIAHFTLHDIRRTVASQLAELKTPPHIIERVLNHATGQISGVAATYNRYIYLTELRAALLAWDFRLQQLAR